MIPQLAVYTTYIPLIYCLLGDYMYHLPPIKGTRNSYWKWDKFSRYRYTGIPLHCTSLWVFLPIKMIGRGKIKKRCLFYVGWFVGMKWGENDYSPLKSEVDREILNQSFGRFQHDFFVAGSSTWQHYDSTVYGILLQPFTSIIPKDPKLCLVNRTSTLCRSAFGPWRGEIHLLCLGKCN